MHMYMHMCMAAPWRNRVHMPGGEDAEAGDGEDAVGVEGAATSTASTSRISTPAVELTASTWNSEGFAVEGVDSIEAVHKPQPFADRVRGNRCPHSGAQVRILGPVESAR